MTDDDEYELYREEVRERVSWNPRDDDGQYTPSHLKPKEQPREPERTDPCRK